MWVVIVREPKPDAVEWPGRRVLAAVDAVFWPMAWIWLVHRVPVPTGVVGQAVAGLAGLCVLTRLRRALFDNARYWFTTRRWGRVVVALWLIGVAIKLTAVS